LARLFCHFPNDTPYDKENFFMQNKLIALTVAGLLVAGPALAESKMTIYGSIDMGFSHRGDNIDSRIGNKNSIDSGSSMGNRLGFKGVEDLGNGLKALFVLENGFKSDTGEAGQMGRLFGRQAFVGLSGDFGMLTAGRLYTPRYSFLMSLDPFHGASMGRYRNVFAAGLETKGENLFDPQRTDNAVAYTTPTWHGFSLKTTYSANLLGSEGSDTLNSGHKNDGNDGDARLIALLPRYTNGPVDLGVSYHKIDFKDVKSDVTDWVVGGAYDFGKTNSAFPLKLAAFYDHVKMQKGQIWAADDIRLKSWMLGAKLPLGRHTLLASWNQSRLDLGDNAPAGSGNRAKSRQWAAGYEYALSKRTTLYGVYADIDNSGFRQDGYKRLSSSAASLGDCGNPGSGYQNGFQFGLRHLF
jgi:predicted porin